MQSLAGHAEKFSLLELLFTGVGRWMGGEMIGLSFPNDSLFAAWRVNRKRANMDVGELIIRLLQLSRQEILEAWTMVLALVKERSEWTESMDI